MVAQSGHTPTSRANAGQAALSFSVRHVGFAQYGQGPPARRPVSLTATHYGQNAMLLGILATLAVLLVLALRTTGHASFGLLEWFLFAEFIALTVWFSVWRYGLR